MSKMILDGKFQELDENGNIKFIKHYTNNKLICVDHLHNENELKYSIHYDDENNCNKIVDSNGHVMYEMKKIGDDIHEHFDLNESNNKFSLINGEFNGQCELCYNYKLWTSYCIKVPSNIFKKNICGIDYNILINIKRNNLAQYIIVINGMKTESALEISDQNANTIREKFNIVNGKIEGEKLEFYYSSWKNALHRYYYYKNGKDFMACKVSNYKDGKITDSKIYKINDYNKDYDYTKDETKQLIFDQNFIFENDYKYYLYYETTFKDYYENYLNINEDDENSNKKLFIHSNGIKCNGYEKFREYNIVDNNKTILKTLNANHLHYSDRNKYLKYYILFNLDEKYKHNEKSYDTHSYFSACYRFNYKTGYVYIDTSYKKYNYVKNIHDERDKLISSVAYKYGKVYEQLFPSPPSILESTINMIKNIIS